jgi:RNA polymerase sigma-70 factor (ECF subfamily)
MDDQEAIQRLKHGDSSGLQDLVLRYQAKAVRVAFLITHDEQLAQDVVQDTFLRIYHRIYQFDENRPFEPYLVRSVVNASLNVARKEAKRLSFDSRLETLESLLSQAASVESEVEYTQLKREIINAIAGLEPRQRAAVIQRYYLGMSEKEMSVALDSPPGTIKWLLNAARAKLRELLRSEGSVE